ncbi:extracellular solute-binding protein [Nocardioides cavernaquae]|uniref:Extracellular solute-binding protein n=2 Tax=Nocardioides cavernaquae TaxID=2321396 RepID=A0A3A5HAY8_9ACTN|nr:extracellular solute-binding protein [Nocardioides cavernaquae]
MIATGCAKAGTGGGDANTLTLWTHNGGNKAELAIVKQIVKDYNGSQDQYTVDVKAFPQESYNSAVTAAATSKKLPCILDTDAPNVASWARSGFLAPLDLPQEVVDKNLDSTKGIYQEKLYSIGYYDAALAVFAHKDALEKAGVRIPTVEEPWTAAEFESALDKIKKSGDYDHAFDLGTGDSGTEWWTYGYSPFLQSFGGDLIDRDGYKTADGVLNGDAAKKWAAWFRGMVTKGYAPAKSSVDAFADFQNGKSAMVWTGIWNAGPLGEVKDGVALPPPDFGNGPKIGGGSWQWAVSSSCAKKDAAMDYLAFSLDPKYLAEFADKQSVVPATEEAAAIAGNGWEEGGSKRFFLDESAAFAELRPITPGYPYLTSTFAKAAQDIIAGGDADKILDKAVTDIDADLKANDNYGN